jgi:hypothetical protein
VYVVRRRAALLVFVHLYKSGFQVTGIEFGIEQWARGPVF